MKNKKQKPKKIVISICENPAKVALYRKMSPNLSLFYSLAAKSYYNDLMRLESEKNSKVEVKSDE